MSILASLNRAYGRMADRGEVAPFGYSPEKIGFVVLLNDDGTPSAKPVDIREGVARNLPLHCVSCPKR